MKKSARYVAKAIAREGWRVWDRKRRTWWGNVFPAHPAALLAELNKDRSSPDVVNLSRVSKPPRKREPAKKPPKGREPRMRSTRG